MTTARSESFLKCIICAVLDLASRFADGRLSTRKLLEADDEELHRMLIEVRGIGTVSNAISDGIIETVIDVYSTVDRYVGP